jgi:hypothetical protein
MFLERLAHPLEITTDEQAVVAIRQLRWEQIEPPARTSGAGGQSGRLLPGRTINVRS